MYPFILGICPTPLPYITAAIPGICSPVLAQCINHGKLVTFPCATLDSCCQPCEVNVKPTWTGLPAGWPPTMARSTAHSTVPASKGECHAAIKQN